MTVDTVNTDIFDDNEITGVLFVWFVGKKLVRVRFDHRAIEPPHSRNTSSEENKRPRRKQRANTKSSLTRWLWQ